jgi:hypothetical protein
MDYFAILLASTSRWTRPMSAFFDWEGEVVFESKTASTAQAIAEALPRAELSSDHIGDRPRGADPVPRVVTTRKAKRTLSPCRPSDLRHSSVRPLFQKDLAKRSPS